MDEPFRLSGHLTPPPQPTPLLWTDGVDTYFARDIEHLEELFGEHNGFTWEHEMEESMSDGWESKPVDDTKLEVWFDSPDDIRRDGPPECDVRATGRMTSAGPSLTKWWAIATRKQWFDAIGYGFVASTEF